MNTSKLSSLTGERLKKYFDLVSNTSLWKDTLDELFSYIREDLIFDNLVIYQTESDSLALDVLYAKSTGRGKSAEAEASWGESIANRVIHENRTISEEPNNSKEVNRINLPYLLGIPLFPVAQLPGVIVFIRFGGPAFSEQDIYVAELAAGLTTSTIRQKLLDEYMLKIEEAKSVSRLQSDFINTISHELRSPLGFIKGYTTTLLRTDTNWDLETQKDFLEIIERETNNLAELIEDLLDSSRLQSGQMKFDFNPVRIDSLIRDEVNRMLLTHPQQKISLEFEPNIPIIEGDSRKLAQVIDNLLSNKVKYAPESSLEINLHKNNNHLEIEFIDDGPGIPEVYQTKIFTRFFRVPDASMKAHGSGLGLFICKQIIDSHEGSISVSSSKIGTTFTILLPFELSTKQVVMEEKV